MREADVGDVGRVAEVAFVSGLQVGGDSEPRFGRYGSEMQVVPFAGVSKHLPKSSSDIHEIYICLLLVAFFSIFLSR